MKFNSQICTTREQSERLLELGLKKETADMRWERISEKYAYYPSTKTPYVSSDIPAWSLHRLLSMLPDDAPKIYWILDGANISMEWENDDSDFFPHRGNMYNGIISCIEWLIKEGYFNKEYLEE